MINEHILYQLYPELRSIISQTYPTACIFEVSQNKFRKILFEIKNKKDIENNVQHVLHLAKTLNVIVIIKNEDIE